MKNFRLSEKSDPLFKVPEKYFEEFPERIMPRLNDGGKTVQVRSINKWLFAAAAVLLIALSITIWTRFNSNDINESELTSYLISEAQLSEDDIASHLEIEEIADIDINLSLEEKTMEDILVTKLENGQLILE